MAQVTPGFPNAADLNFGQAPDLTTEKKQQVALAGEAIRSILGTPDEQQRLAIAMAEGNDLGQSYPAQIISMGLPFETLTRLGPDVAAMAPAITREMREYEAARNQDRSRLEEGADALLGVNAGIVGTAGGLAALGVGGAEAMNLLPDGAGGWVSERVTEATEGLRSLQSSELQDARALAQQRAQLDDEDLQRRYDIDAQENGGLIAELQRIGRGIGRSAEDLWENPVLAGDMAIEGLGSLAVGGAAGRALNLSERAFTALIGAMEAGGSYTSVQSQVRAMSEEDLFARSPEYAALRESGMGHENARIHIANAAANTAAAISGVVGAATGSLTARFERNPFGAMAEEAGVSSLLARIGRETMSQGVEEGLQGGAAVIAEGTGIRTFADNERDVTAGLGRAITEGAVAGLGMTGMVNAPQLATAGAIGTAAGLGEAVSSVGDAIRTGVDALRTRVDRQLDAESPVGSNATREAVTNFFSGAQAALQRWNARMATMPTETAPATTPNVDPVQDLNARVSGLMNVNATEVNSLSDDVRNLFLDAGEQLPENMVLPRDVVINEVIKELSTGSRTPAEVAASSLWLREQASNMQSLLDEYSANLPPAMRSQIADLRGAVDTFISNETVTGAIKQAETITSEEAFGELPVVTPESLGSTEVQVAIQNQDRLAVANPAGVDAAFLREVLNQSDGMDAAQRARLEAAARLAEQGAQAEAEKERIRAKAEEDLKAMGKSGKASTARRNIVRDQILVDGKQEKYEQLSLSRHQARILEALNRGNSKVAQAYFDRLGNFAQHMLNKLEAGEKSKALGKRKDNAIKYETWMGQGWIASGMKTANEIGISPFSPVSMALLEDVRVDANSVVQTYNNLLEIFGADGSLVGEPKTVPGYSEDITDGEADTSAEEGQGDQGGTDEAGQGETDEGEAGTPPAKTGNANGGEGSGSTGAGGLTSDPLTSNLFGEPIDLKAIRRKIRDLNAAIRELKRDWRETRQAQRELWNEVSRFKRPLTELLKGKGIDPQETIGIELKTQGITAHTVPGLFKKGGLTDLSNLVRSEWEESLPGITDATSTGWTDDHLDQQGLIDVIVLEAGGNSSWLVSRQMAAQYDQYLDDIASEIRAREDERDELKAILAERETDEQVSGRGRLGGRKRDGRYPAGRPAARAKGSLAGARSQDNGAAGQNAAAQGSDEADDGSQGDGGTTGTGQGGVPGIREDASSVPGVATPTAEYLLEAELTDVGTLLDLLGIEHGKGSGALPSEQELVDAQTSAIAIYERLKSGDMTLEKARTDLVDLLSWVPQTKDGNADRRNRAMKSAEKHGQGNLEASYVVQLAEEIGEIIAELVKANPASDLDPRSLEVTKRRLKVLRFGPDTIIKGDGPYAGLTNQEAYEAALAAAPAQAPSFENLPIRNGLNRFTRAYVIDPLNAPLLALASPVSHVLGILNDWAGRKAELPNTPSTNMNEGHLDPWRYVMATEVPYLVDRLNQRLRTQFQSGNGRPLLNGKTPLGVLEEALNEGSKTDWTNIRQTRGLNLVDTDTGNYDTRLVEAAAMAAMHWYLTTPAQQNLDDEDISKIFNIDESQINATVRAMANSGLNAVNATEALSRVILQFWGAQTNREAPMSDTRGIVEHLAKELLIVMSDGQGRLITPVWTEITTSDGKPKTVLSLKLKHQTAEKLVEALHGATAFLGDAFAPMAKRPFRFGEPRPVEEMRRTQKGNPISRLGAKMRKALQVQSESPFLRNTNQVNLMKALGQDLWADLMGFEAVEPGVTNVMHAAAIEGKNTTIRLSWDGVMRYDAELEAYAQANGLDPNAVETFMDYYAASNERQMIEGFNPQADKGMREVAVVTRSVLDLGKRADVESFWLTVGQSSGLVKTEGGTAVTNAELAEQKVDENFGLAVEILREWVRDGAKGEMPLETRQALKEAVFSGSKGKPVSAKLMHALMAVARFREATENFDEENPTFVHDLSLEADGKTDGPINAIINFTTGLFTDAWLKTVRRGGLFLNEYDQTLNAQGMRDSLNGRPNDLYTQTGVLANAYYAKRRAWLNQRNDTRAMGEALDYMLARLGDVKVSKDGKSIEVTRDGVKNPVTITGYGSSENGIAGKVVNLMLDNLYAELTLMEKRRREYGDPTITLDEDEKLRKALNLLTHRRLSMVKENGKWTWDILSETKNKQSVPPLKNLRNGRDFTLSPEQFDMLRENLRMAYVKPMSQAIKESFGNAMETLDLMKKASQYQSVAMLEGFRNAVKITLEAKREAGELESGEFLSEKDYDNIFKRLAKYGAVIEGVEDTENSLNLSIDERGEGMQEFARSFEEQLSGMSNMAMPKLAGVSAAPQFTISRGDAKMMVNFFASEEAIEAGAKRSFQVYDGLEMPADLIKQLSAQINKAVMEGWLENHVQDFADSFRDWFRHDPFALVQSVEGFGQMARIAEMPASEFEAAVTQSLAEAVKAGRMTAQRASELKAKLGRKLDNHAALDKALTKPETALMAELLQPILKEAKVEAEATRDSLLAAARSTQARKNVFARIGFSVDHMASGESPWTHEGERFDGNGSEIDWLNRLYEEELAKIPDPLAPKDTPAVEKGSAEFVARVEAYGNDATVTPGMPVKKMRVSDLLNALEHRSLPEAHLPVLKAIRKLVPKDFLVVTGSPEAVTNWRDSLFPEKRGTGAIKLGQTDLGNGVIYIGNISGETALHELLHAVLANVISRFYAGDESIDETQATAISNLEKLMFEFVGLSFEGERPAVASVARVAQDEITRRVGYDAWTAEEASPGNRMGALLEFISWTLTNQNLAETLDTVRVRSKLSSLKRLANEALKNLAKFLGLKRQPGTTDEVGLRMFQNIRWNTHALLRTMTADDASVVNSAGLPLDQLDPASAGNQDIDRLRMRALRERFETKIGAHLKTFPNAVRADTEELDAYRVADDAVNRFRAAGVLLDPEQASTFRVIQAAMATSMQIAPGAMAQTQRLFQKILSDLTTEKLMRDPTDDFERIDKGRIFDALVGKRGTEKDKYGRSNLMASVLALAMVDPEFRRVLNQQPLPKDRGVVWTSVDEFLESVGESMMNSLATAVSEDGRGFMATVKGRGSRTQLEALDKLAAVLSRIETDDRLALEKRAGELMDLGDEKAQNLLGRAGDWLRETAAPIVEGLAGSQDQSLRAVAADGAASAIRGLAALTSVERTASYAEAGVSLMNNSTSPLLPQTIKRLFAEIVGTTRENAAVHKILNQVKAMVSASRQEYREKLPEFFAKQFSRKLTDTEWSAMHKVFGEMDIGALDRMRSDELRALFEEDGAALDLALKRAEEDVGRHSGKDKKILSLRMKKAEELARFMATYEIDPSNTNLLKNAKAVGRLLGEPEMLKGHPSRGLVDALDRFITLRALTLTKTTNPAAWAAVQALAKDEAKGVDFLVHYLMDLRRRELAKATSETASYNAWKGYIPAETRAGAQLIVAHDSENKRLTSMGFTRLGDYIGSGYELGRRGYYFSTVGGNSTYVQGALQTVHTTAMGVNALSGRNTSGITGGVISGETAWEIQDAITEDQNNGYKPKFGQPLISIYDGKTGKILGYERSLSPEMRQVLKRNTHLGEMLGAWAGRLEEERMAQSYNEALIDALKAQWLKGKREGREKEYVNIADPGEMARVFGHSWEMIPQETKDYIAKVFDDEDGFMVRQEMIDNAMGYRMPSVAQAWTKKDKADETQAHRVIRDVATVILGKKAMPWLVTAEKEWMAGISMAKNTIVVRSVIVPLSNIASNVFQLMARGVPVRSIWKGMGPKLIEINTYLRNKEREVEINALMARYRNESLPTAKLKAELKALEDANKRLSIWPLIAAGEFSTISEGQVEVDAAIAEGTWAEYMRDKLDKIPAALGTAGRYAFISRDTALFQGMSRAVQYGDFLAKAVYFDHLTQAKKTPAAEAMVKIGKEFVNYNLLPGPVRSYAESMGLTWFWAYKLRSIGVALNQMQENPLRALLMSYAGDYVPSMTGISVGSPLSDNAVNVILEGRAPYSLGLDMFWAAPGLNPWLNLAT